MSEPDVDLDRAAVLRTFAGEGEELLAAIEAGLLALEAHPRAAANKAELLRLAHTMKGNASLFGFDDVVAAAHAFESLLQATESPPAPAQMARLLAGFDALGAAFRAALRDGADGRAPEADATIRVDLGRFDRMLEMLGEVLVARARTDWEALERPVRELEGLVASARTVPIGPSFRPYARMVRDLAAAHGKRARLEVSGEEVEVDARVVEQLRDPLTHLLRNAIDHGIEAPERRVAAGKDAVGLIRLRAHREGGQLQVTLADDGGGIDRGRVVRRAAERGHGDVSRWDDRRLYGLLFEPGFSTADDVTELSGRGVGLDVVLGHLQALRGRVDVETAPGDGTAFHLRVPITVALLGCFAVEAGGETYLLPSDAVRACLELGDAGDGATAVVNVRGEPLACVRLGEMFGAATAAARPSVVVVEHGRERAGLVVDRLVGEQQTMVKPLARLFRRAEVVSGSAVLGSGRIALVVDVASVIRRAAEQSGGGR
ncbi:MAG TPA: chemotaxis protein CheW [Polyangia bacterium]|nr:chemotaxis protein CheW [Polyangia bacterium]